MRFLLEYRFFYISIVLGILIWSITFIFLPVQLSEPFKMKTAVFIITNYLALIGGFCVFKFKIKESNTPVPKPVKTVNILIVLIVISYVFRWIDLFLIRELSYSNGLKENRYINVLNQKNSNFLFIFASILKSIYFFPFVISIKSKLKARSISLLLSYLILLFPLIEAFLMGTRKPMFEIFAIVLITHLIFNRKTFTWFKAVAFAVFFSLIMIISGVILFKRETQVKNIETDFYSLILNARYNEVLEPNKSVISFFKKSNISQAEKSGALMLMQIGQYITHGVFEFNHIIDDNSLPQTYGKYTFYAIPKLINKTKIFKEIEITNPSPREHVYLTAFGGLFIDFRWLTLVFMIFLGAAQKYIYQQITNSFIYAPILVYFLLINVFLLYMNYIRGGGIYPFFAFLFCFALLIFLKKRTHEKSPNS